jgi:hypothetical protein
MILRSLAVLLSMSVAPLQCEKSYDPSLRKEDTPGDALWQLARKFHEEHDEAGARRTLEFLVERYPSSRWAPAAREELGETGDAARPADGG